MGCISSRELSEEEATITRAEELLGYSNSHAFRNDAIFRKYASNGELNDRQFKDAADVLRITTTKTTGLDKIDEFYQKFRAEDVVLQQSTASGKYRLKRLLLLGLLLGAGGNKEKANLLFEIYDTDAVHTLTSQQIAKMIAKIFYIAVNVLPILSLKPDRTREVNYVENLKLTKVKSVEELTKLILDKNTSVEKEKFAKVFETNEILKPILTSHGFRGFCHKVYKANPSPWYLTPKKTDPVVTQRTVETSQSGAQVVTEVTVEKTVVVQTGGQAPAPVAQPPPLATPPPTSQQAPKTAPPASTTAPPAPSTAPPTSAASQPASTPPSSVAIASNPQPKAEETKKEV